MQLMPEDIQTFIDAWEADFGERLAVDIADLEAKRIIQFFLDLAKARLDAVGNAAVRRDTMAA